MTKDLDKKAISQPLESLPDRDTATILDGTPENRKDLRSYLENLNAIINGSPTHLPAQSDRNDPISVALHEVGELLAKSRATSLELTTAFELERKKLLEQDWIKSIYTDIFDKLKGIKTIKALAEIAVSELTQAVNAQVAVFLVANNLDGTAAKNADPHLIVTASYGTRIKPDQAPIVIGEGMLGQTCKDQKTKYLDTIPEDYVHIESALGKTRATVVAMIPFILEDKLMGALEIASISKFSTAQRLLLEMVCANIGVNIRSISSAMYNETLLEEIAITNSSLESQKRALDASAIVAETDARGIITYVNDKFLEISKYSRDELIGQDHRILNSKYHPKEFFLDLWRTISAGKIWKNEVRNKTKDGSIYWVDTTIYPVKSNLGILEKFVAIRFDITTQKETETKLRAASTSILSQKQALDSAAIVAETDVLGRITYVNDKFLEISKYSRDQILGQDHIILNSGHHPKAFFNSLWKTISTGSVWHGEVKNKAADGTYYWVDTTVYPAKDEFGKIIKYVAIRFDITDRKHAEESLKEATARANAAVAAKSNFLANISHEIRTPLNGIFGFTNLLAEQELTDEQAKYIQTIKSCGELLQVLINDFLDFSKIEAGRIDLEMHPIDLPQLIDSASNIVNKMLTDKGLVFEKRFSPSAPQFIVSDPTRIKQIIINLLSNAAKFTAKGKVTISTDVVSADGKNVELVFCVADTGIGISKANVSKLFTAFTQADSSTNRKYGGTGLGLSICKSIVELLGGKIWIESEEAVGSKFFFTIKVLAANPGIFHQSKKAGDVTQAKLGQIYPLKILVADDNKVNQLLIGKMLKTLDYDMTIVDNGQEAVDAAVAGDYDVILMDVQMPVMDGLEATRTIRERLSNHKRPEVIALTANAMVEDRQACLEAGMRGFASKPIGMRYLADELLCAAQRLGIKANDVHAIDEQQALKPTGT
jgi:PAS domain S-box-containing protein